MTKLVNEQWRTPEAVTEACKELRETMELLNGIALQGKRIAVFMGSAQTAKNDPFYAHAKATAEAMGKSGFAILSGGGTGIMQAAHEGARAAKTESIGIQTELIPDEKTAPDLFDHQKGLKMFFARRFALLTVADCIIVYPGGFGTLNEFSEFIMLLQQSIVENVPIILAQSRGKIAGTLEKPECKKPFWEALREFMKTHMADEGFIAPGDEKTGQIIDIEDVTPEQLAEMLSKQK